MGSNMSEGGKVALAQCYSQLSHPPKMEIKHGTLHYFPFGKQLSQVSFHGSSLYQVHHDFKLILYLLL